MLTEKPVFVQDQSAKTLHCKTCKKPLSHFPIYIHQNQGSICGRCPIPVEDVIRNTTYEDLAKTLKFACCYSNLGCLENLFPEDIPKHEKTCIFQKYVCPTASFTNCDWQGTVDKMEIHFNKKHPTFILEDQFEIDLIHSHDEKYLMLHEGNPFIVTRANDTKNGTFTINVSNLGGIPSTVNYSYKLTLNNETVSEIKHLLNTPIKLDIINLKEILNDPVSVIGRIIILEEVNEPPVVSTESIMTLIDDDLLRSIECFSCMEYMRPPIFQCQGGHSICAKCKSGLEQCPTCQKKYSEDLRNRALEDMISFLPLPCKNCRCTFTAKLKELVEHELVCMYSLFKCPLHEYYSCSEMISYQEIYNHVKSQHYENLLEMDTITVPFDPNNLVGSKEDTEDDCYLVKYGEYLFILHYLFDDNRFNWSMQLIGSAKDCKKFKFEIDVLDNCGGEERICLRRPVVPVTPKLKSFAEFSYMFLELDQIRDMISTKLSYRMRIIE